MDDQGSENAEDLREYARVGVNLEGRLFMAADASDSGCTVSDLSATGAKVSCDRRFRFGSRIMAYIENFGRFEGVAVPHDDGGMGLHFIQPLSLRERLAELLQSYRQHGQLPGMTARLRRHPRTPSIASGYFALRSRTLVPCDLLDISAQGLSLKTSLRPPVGEIVKLGNSFGRIVRHHGEGIGVQLMHVVGN
jgi:hypothetical protein